MLNFIRYLVRVFFLLLLSSCARTTVTILPPAQEPVCSSSNTAIVVWATRWRSDQKDVAAREKTAESGLREFLARSGCFANSELLKAENLEQSTLRTQLVGRAVWPTKIVGVEIRELGPIVKLLSSIALVEGGTEVVLRIIEYSPDSLAERRQFVVHWEHGGAGVIKGVASLQCDMQAALSTSLKPGERFKLCP